MANVGDCEAVLCRGGIDVLLTSPHSPDGEIDSSLSPLHYITDYCVLCAVERTRIEDAGGWVTTEKELFVCRLHKMDLTDEYVRSHMKV